VTVTNYIWDVENDTCLMETDENGATKVVYSHEATRFGGLISQRREGQTYYHHYDALGSTRQLTDAGENVTDEYVYTAWGEPVVANGTTENPYRWVGRWGYYWDEATGTYSVRERDLEPTTSLWLSVDPIGVADSGFGLYTYVVKSPITKNDPSGLEWLAIRSTGIWYPTTMTDALVTMVRDFNKIYPFFDLDPFKNRYCIRPSIDHLDPKEYARLRAEIESQWKMGLGHPCVRYDADNLENTWSGGHIVASVGTDHNHYIERATAFYRATAYPRGDKGPDKLANDIAKQAEWGKRPLQSVTIIGHSWYGKDRIGSIDGRSVVFSLANLKTAGGGAGIWYRPSWEDALKGKLPPGCWLSVGAEVRLVGCRTAGFARTIYEGWLRGFAKAYGTSEPTYAAPDGTMGWADKEGFPGTWVPHPTAGYSKSPEEYHQAPYWVEVPPPK
jgi:RHS repeat-associated protein